MLHTCRDCDRIVDLAVQQPRISRANDQASMCRIAEQVGTLSVQAETGVVTQIGERNGSDEICNRNGWFQIEFHRRSIVYVRCIEPRWIGIEIFNRDSVRRCVSRGNQ